MSFLIKLKTWATRAAFVLAGILGAVLGMAIWGRSSADHEDKTQEEEKSGEDFKVEQREFERMSRIREESREEILSLPDDDFDRRYPLFPEMPPREEIASWIAVKPTFSHEEVTEMVEALMTIALEEIETTSRETARDVAAEEAGKTAYYKDLAERERLRVQALEKENQKLVRRCWILGGTSVGLGGLAGGVWLMNR